MIPKELFLQTKRSTDADPNSVSPCAGRGKFLAICALLSLVFANVDCQHIGPPTVERDRVAYNEAIAASWKEQLLLNIVRLRYHDIAEFVDVGPVTQAHTLTREVQASFGASLLPNDSISNTLTPGLTGTGMTTDQPTITYTPQSGSDFTNNLITPIKPSQLFNLIEANYHNVINQGVISINGLRNDPRDPSFDEFKKLALAMREAYCKGDISFPQTQPDSGDRKVFMMIAEEDSKFLGSCHEMHRATSPPHPVAFIRAALHLKASVTKFEIVVGPRPTKETEIAVRTRSAISAMIFLSKYVRVPATPLTDGPYLQRWEWSVPRDFDPPLTVYCGPAKPKNKYAAVKYHDYWFWIDWDDYNSNQSLIYVRTLLALADTGARPTGPILTIPAR